MTDKKSPAERVADLFFYAPLGFVLGLDEIVPQLIERGRAQVAVARMFGEVAVRQGQSEAAKVLDQLGKLTGWQGLADQEPSASPAASSPGPSAPSSAATASPSAAHSTPAPPESGTAASSVAADDGGRDGFDAVTLAIPDYDSLSASQVVPRLEGLSTDELEEVRAYEAARRGRKTILNKVAQLQQPSP